MQGMYRLFFMVQKLIPENANWKETLKIWRLWKGFSLSS
jgi:hypothetical protein